MEISEFLPILWHTQKLPHTTYPTKLFIAGFAGNR